MLDNGRTRRPPSASEPRRASDSRVDRRRRELLSAASLAPIAAPIAVRAATLGSIALATVACGGSDPAATPPPPSRRTWSMGFSGLPPRPDTATLLHGIDLWSTRAEIAAIHEELPWTDLLAGMSADAILDRDKVQLVQYYRDKGLKLYFMADLTDGLARDSEAPQLRALGRSLAEPAVQQVYRYYVAAVVRKLQPEYIGLAAETNLIRVAAPPALYAAVVQAANAAAADLQMMGAIAPRFISIQVETAWGLLGNGGAYVGVDVDFQDFPFASMLGLSSYPYFAFARPEDIPANYYSRPLTGRSLPAMVVEGGWTSVSAGAIVSSPDAQARYLSRHAQLLDGIQARGVIQLEFADLDLSTFPQPQPANLPLFVNLGLTDSNFVAKPALAIWDAQHARPLG
jgi:hypothetical protein